jgi:hypothetical protein
LEDDYAAQFPRFQESYHPCVQYTRGLEDMTNASLQRSFKADVRRRMSPPHRQSVAQISAELGIHIVTLYNWSNMWELAGVDSLMSVYPCTRAASPLLIQ